MKKKSIRFEVEYDSKGTEKKQGSVPDKKGTSLVDRAGRTRGRQSVGQKGSQAKAGATGKSPSTTRIKNSRA